MMPSKTYIAMILAASMFAGVPAWAAQYKWTVDCNKGGAISGTAAPRASDGHVATVSGEGLSFSVTHKIANVGDEGRFKHTGPPTCPMFKKQLEDHTITTEGITWTVDCDDGTIRGTDANGVFLLNDKGPRFVETTIGTFETFAHIPTCHMFQKQLEAPTTTESGGQRAAACTADDWQCLAAQVQAQAQAAAAAKAQAAAAAKEQAAAAAQAQAADAARLAREEMRAEIARLTAKLDNGWTNGGMFGLKAGDESEGVSAGAVAATAVQTATSDNKSTTDSTVVALLAVLVVLAVMNVALQMVPRAGQQVATPYRDLEGHQNMENMRKTSYYEPRTSVAEI